MQPETVREVQTHLLSSVSSNFAILQSLQGRNEGSTVHIPDGSCMRKRVCSVQQTPHSPISGLRCLLCPSIPFLHPERWQPLSPWLLIPLLLATYCHVPTVCPTVSFSKSLVALCKHSSVSLQNLSFSVFLVLYKKKKKKLWVPWGGIEHQECLDPKVCFHLVWLLPKLKTLVHAYYLLSSL